MGELWVPLSSQSEICPSCQLDNPYASPDRPTDSRVEAGAEIVAPMLPFLVVWPVSGAVATGGVLTRAGAARLIGFGTGHGVEAAQATLALARSLTPQMVREMAKAGLTREQVLEQLALYRGTLQEGGRALINKQLLPRIEVLERILELWPK